MEKAHEAKELELTSAARGVWLVKVPKYLSERWKKAGPGGEVGKLKITRHHSAKQGDVVFCLDDSLKTTSESEEQIPSDHKFTLAPVGSQALTILSTEQIPDHTEVDDELSTGGASGGGVAISKYKEGKVAIVGKVIQRGECRPMNNDTNYLSHIKNRMEIGNRPQQSVVQLDKTVINYKPTSMHPHLVMYEMKKKEEGKKIRGDKDKVMDMLFAAFESYQYYNVKDLVRLTQQPITFLKEILKEICVYNMKAPNKNTWELKPEYRHYRKPAGGGASSMDQHNDS